MPQKNNTNEDPEDNRPDLETLLASRETQFKSKIEYPASGPQGKPLEVALNNEGIPGRRGDDSESV